MASEEANGTTTTTSSSSGTSRKTVKKTVVEVVEESDESNLKEQYRPLISSKNVIIQRSGFIGGQQQGRGSYGAERSIRYSQTASLPPGASLALIKSTGVGAVQSSRETEKKSLQDLNERLANYIEKVRFLEAQNKRLADELDKLKSKWGKETSAVKAMYQAELDEARKLLDEANKEKGRLGVQVASLEEVLDELRRRSVFMLSIRCCELSPRIRKARGC
jgi:intermediate filament protein if